MFVKPAITSAHKYTIDVRRAQGRIRSRPARQHIRVMIVVLKRAERQYVILPSRRMNKGVRDGVGERVPYSAVERQRTYTKKLATRCKRASIRLEEQHAQQCPFAQAGAHTRMSVIAKSSGSQLPQRRDERHHSTRNRPKADRVRHRTIGLCAARGRRNIRTRSACALAGARGDS